MGSCGSGVTERASHNVCRPRKQVNAAFEELPRLTTEYLILGLLGKGTFGAVYHCKRVREPEVGVERAVKVLKRVIAGQKNPITEIQVKAERSVGKLAPHENLIKQYDFCDSPKACAFVYECCTGGEVLYNLGGRPVYTEGTVCVVVKGLLRGIAHLHAGGLAHLDVKPQNIVFTRRPEPDQPICVNDIRLIDFGAVTPFQRGKPSLTIAAGSPHFAAPEVLRYVCAMGANRAEGLPFANYVETVAPEPFDARCDVYSATVVAFILLMGRHPFVSEQLADTVPVHKFISRILQGDICLPPSFAALSLEAQAVVRSGLALHFTMRPTAEEMLTLPWLAECGDDEGAVDGTADSDVEESDSAGSVVVSAHDAASPLWIDLAVVGRACSPPLLQEQQTSSSHRRRCAQLRLTEGPSVYKEAYSLQPSQHSFCSCTSKRKINLKGAQRDLSSVVYSFQENDVDLRLTPLCETAQTKAFMVALREIPSMAYTPRREDVSTKFMQAVAQLPSLNQSSSRFGMPHGRDGIASPHADNAKHHRNYTQDLPNIAQAEEVQSTPDTQPGLELTSPVCLS